MTIIISLHHLPWGLYIPLYDEAIIRLGEPAEWMYIIDKGLVGCKGKVHGAGSSVGYDIALNRSASALDVPRRREYWAFSINNTVTVGEGGANSTLAIEQAHNL